MINFSQLILFLPLLFLKWLKPFFVLFRASFTKHSASLTFNNKYVRMVKKELHDVKSHFVVVTQYIDVIFIDTKMQINGIILLELSFNRTRVYSD